MAMIVHTKHLGYWGLTLVGVGSYLIYVAYDKKGGTRPFWTRFIPGL